MPFDITTSVSAFAVFIQGLLSFLSPCVLPLLPVYISYFAGSAKEVDENGDIVYPRKKVLLNTVFFIVGISAAFFLLGFGFTALGKFFTDNRIWFARISGIIMALFGLYQLGFFGQSRLIEKEKRLPMKASKVMDNPLYAILLGFTFSFAWTPCVGPTLGSVLLMAGSTGTMAKGFILIGIYTLGFTLPFLAVGLFTKTVLGFFKKHVNVVKYTVKIGAVLLITMGVMTTFGFMNGFTDYLSKPTPTPSPTTSVTEKPNETVIPSHDFEVVDQNGNTVKLSDYKGKVVFLNFWATWCPPCRAELPDIQKLYDKYKGSDEVVILAVASPNYYQEGDENHVKNFLDENGYTMTVPMDMGGDIVKEYAVSAFPTTFMIDKQGNFFGYVKSAISYDIMESIIAQTLEGKK